MNQIYLNKYSQSIPVEKALVQYKKKKEGGSQAEVKEQKREKLEEAEEIRKSSQKKGENVTGQAEKSTPDFKLGSWEKKNWKKKTLQA